MLLDHEVEFAEVLLIAQPGAQNRPEVVILGLVVADELVTKLLSSVLGWSRNRLGTLEARRDLLEPGAVAPHSLRMGPRPGKLSVAVHKASTTSGASNKAGSLYPR